MEHRSYIICIYKKLHERVAARLSDILFDDNVELNQTLNAQPEKNEERRCSRQNILTPTYYLYNCEC